MKTYKAPGPWKKWWAWFPVTDEWGHTRWMVMLERRWNPARGACGGWEYRTPK